MFYTIYDCSMFYKQSAESKLAKFVEDIIVPPRMVDIVVDGEVFLIFVEPAFLLLLSLS